ncbi:mitochondrial aspartate-glutamate transporter AGC1 [Impatiens glandulifera]|uniref:mitochondrial aspartate-glutamate transporter AGC1 n=1 Tax=Impatiens glandulifera TaxID=253017 RepID=UPI001FB19596|nr:mitochondrial aspartate-glutamate transporter AGC1 [Impatiens glandulifera]
MDEQLKTITTHAFAAATAVSLGSAISYPLDTIKVLIQVGSGTNKPLTTAQILGRVQSISGNSGLYSGLGWLTTGRIAGLGARFGVYEILTAFYKDGREYSYVHTGEAFTAGMVAGAFESLLSSPFELVKLRAQVNSASWTPRSTVSAAAAAEKATISGLVERLLPGNLPNMKTLNQSVNLLATLGGPKQTNMIDSVRKYPWMMTGSGRPPSITDVRSPSQIISLEGWSSLWRGLRSGIVRDSIFGGTFFASWEFLHRVLITWKAVGMESPPESDEDVGPLSPIAVSLAAGVSGTVAAAASHCFDTAKSRSQCIVLPKFLYMERKFLKWKTPGKWFERQTGIHPSDRNILFRGIWLRMARSGSMSFVVVGGYLLGIDLLLPK